MGIEQTITLLTRSSSTRSPPSAFEPPAADQGAHQVKPGDAPPRPVVGRAARRSFRVARGLDRDLQGGRDLRRGLEDRQGQPLRSRVRRREMGAARGRAPSQGGRGQDTRRVPRRARRHARPARALALRRHSLDARQPGRPRQPERAARVRRPADRPATGRLLRRSRRRRGRGRRSRRMDRPEHRRRRRCRRCSRALPRPRRRGSRSCRRGGSRCRGCAARRSSSAEIGFVDGAGATVDEEHRTPARAAASRSRWAAFPRCSSACRRR